MKCKIIWNYSIGWTLAFLFLVIIRGVGATEDGNLIRLFPGRFYHPAEEERIFMFLDLQSSTHLAEKLGHVQYSFLLQDCFEDLGIVAQNGAQVYQYVGDEVILTWNLRQGLTHQHCLWAYYNFTNRLQSRRQYYQQRYGCFPFFKAGLHSGLVTVTEIGKLKAVSGDGNGRPATGEFGRSGAKSQPGASRT